MTSLEDFWFFLENSFEEQGKSPRTIDSRKSTFFLYTKLLKTKKFSDFESLEKAKIFLKLRREAKLKDSTLKKNINVLSEIVQHCIEIQDFEETPYRFQKNVFQYILRKTHFARDTESHKARTIHEIRTWIRLIDNKKHLVLNCLFAIGLRSHEAIQLKKSQFILEEKYIANVKRKGNRIHKKVGIPDFIIKILTDYIKDFTDNEILFHKYSNYGSLFARKHFKRIMKIKNKLEERQELNPYWQDFYDGLQLIEDGGLITPHQLRTSWDTIAEKNRMRESYRRYSLNHRLHGSDEIYIQIHQNPDVFKDYLIELNRCTPNFLV